MSHGSKTSLIYRPHIISAYQDIGKHGGSPPLRPSPPIRASITPITMGRNYLRRSLRCIHRQHDKIFRVGLDLLGRYIHLFTHREETLTGTITEHRYCHGYKLTATDPPLGFEENGTCGGQLPVLCRDNHARRTETTHITPPTNPMLTMRPSRHHSLYDCV